MKFKTWSVYTTARLFHDWVADEFMHDLKLKYILPNDMQIWWAI